MEGKLHEIDGKTQREMTLKVSDISNQGERTNRIALQVKHVLEIYQSLIITNWIIGLRFSMQSCPDCTIAQLQMHKKKKRLSMNSI